MPHFVVTEEQGPAWNPSRSMREQEKWIEHASFVDALADEGLLVLAGPSDVGHRHRAILVMNAASEQTLRARLVQDPWMPMGILRILTIELWEVLVGKERLGPGNPANTQTYRST